MYVKITQILKSSVDNKSEIVLSNKNQQLQIEETLKFFWNEELNSMFQGKKSLFSNYVGINMLMSSISKLDKVLNLFKQNNKTYIRNKDRKAKRLSKRLYWKVKMKKNNETKN